ncbi:MAG: hypothetical protein ACLQLH_01330 [Terracidiphilus sp.]|jgi:hypothetical protein
MGSMGRFGLFRAVLAVASAAALCATLAAQTDAGEDLSAAGLKVKQVPEAVQPVPYSSDSLTPFPVAPIEYRSYDRMTEKDRLQAADAEASIGEHAHYVGLEFNQGKWNYQQVVCPVFRNHIFLRFTHNNGIGDVSMFTASVPTNGEGRVRIIPIQMRGYSLWSPAPINALTISAFNHIRAEESDQSRDWLQTGLCYAALAGGHPVAAKLNEDTNSLKFPAAMPAELTIPVHDGEEVSFTDVSARPKLMEWTMIFNRKGKLMKAKHTPLGLLKVSAVPPAEALPSTPVPRTIGDVPDDSGH